MPAKRTTQTCVTETSTCTVLGAIVSYKKCKFTAQTSVDLRSGGFSCFSSRLLRFQSPTLADYWPSFFRFWVWGFFLSSMAPSERTDGESISKPSTVLVASKSRRKFVSQGRCLRQCGARPFKLPSGRVVRVLGTGRIDFPKGPPALMLKYETDLKISDTDALRKEVDEIFAVLKVDAENGQFRSAIVSANEKRSVESAATAPSSPTPVEVATHQNLWYRPAAR